MNKVIVNKVLTRDRGRCYYCGSTPVELHHIVYRSHSGIDDEKNLICLCRKCHSMVHSDEKKYREELLNYMRGVYGCIEIEDLKKPSKWKGFKY